MGKEGLTLTETLVSLVIFLATLGGILPLYVTSRLSTLENNIETSAIAISQQIMDELRQVDVTTLPNSGSDPARIFPYENTGNNFQAIINYCQRPQFCDASSRHVQVSITLDGRPNAEPVYQVETIFTDFSGT